MAELQPQPQMMKMTIRALIPSPNRPIQGNKDPSRGYGPVLQKESSPRACNTSVNTHPGGIPACALLQVHAAISLSFLVETHTLAAWNRCLLLPGTHLFEVIIFLTAVSLQYTAFLFTCFTTNWWLVLRSVAKWHRIAARLIKCLQCRKRLLNGSNLILFIFQKAVGIPQASFNLPCLSVTSDSLRRKRGCCLPPDSQWITLASDRCQAWQTCCSFRRPGDYTESERYGAVSVHLQIHNLEAARDGFERFFGRKWWTHTCGFLTFMIKVKNFTGVIFIDLVNAQMRVRGTAGFVMCIWPKSNCLYTASEEPIHLQD